MARIREEVQLHLMLDHGVPQAARRLQVAIIDAIDSGSLKEGDRLPSTRMMASTYELSRTAVVETYETLCGLGILVAATGSGTRVRSGARSLISGSGEPQPPTIATEPTLDDALDLTVPSSVDMQAIDRTEWNRAWRMATDPSVRTHQNPPLEAVLEDHLRSFRGVALRDNLLLVRPAIGAAIADLVHGLRLKARGVAVEDPGYPRVHRHLVNLGCRVHWVPVDDQGLRVDALGPDVAAVHVTPARQWPTGVAMSLERRVALLRWAEATGGVIIENDQDAEFSHETNPLPTLYSMSPDTGRVIYLGSSSKFISPDLEIVWLVVPPGFPRRSDDVAPVSDYVARALAHFIDSGALYRHRNRTLTLYRERREALVRKIQGAVPGLVVMGDPIGTELLIALPPECDEISVQMRIEQAGFQVSTLGDFAMRHHRPAILVGFGDLAPAQAGTLAQAIARACASQARPDERTA